MVHANLSLDHPDETYRFYLLMEALGTPEPDFCGPLLTQLARAATHGQNVNERAINFMVSVIKGVQPKDQVETMLAAQMAAVHILTMDFARRLNNVDTVLQQDSAERAFNKLARTFAAQVEALKRYRTGGEQKVTVEHVTVNLGGKAIVGNMTHGMGQVPPKNGRRPHECGLSIPEKPSVLCDFKTDEKAVHGSRRKWLDRLPVSRSAWRRAERQTKRNVSPRVLYW